MIDENTVAVVAASCRAGTFSALTRDEHTDLVRSIILAYEAAKPSPPMSTSGVMVERLRSMEAMFRYWDSWNRKARDKEGLPTVDNTHMMSVPPEWPSHGVVRRWAVLMDEAASRIEALEARVAEQAGEIEKLRHIIDRRGDKIIELSERALSAEADLAKGGG